MLEQAVIFLVGTGLILTASVFRKIKRNRTLEAQLAVTQASEEVLD